MFIKYQLYEQFANSLTQSAEIRNDLNGRYSAHLSVMIIRGIGYRAFLVVNDFSRNENAEEQNHLFYEFPYNRYLIIRAGHTDDMYQALPSILFVKISKKDRKLVIFSRSLLCVKQLSKYVIKYRLPSVYTGRGVRSKGIKHIRKAGKKDKQKGKAF